MDVLIIEDHPLIIMGLKMIILECDPSANFTEAETFPDGLSVLGDSQIDIVILDIEIPGSENIKMIDKIREKRRNAIILIHSGYDETVYALPFLKAGADGFLSKQASKEEIKLAWHTLLAKRKYASANVQQQLLNNISEHRDSTSANSLKSLSPNELQVVQLMNEGKWTKEIASIMNLKENTISTYKRRIYDKLGVNGPVELAQKISVLKYF